MKQYCETPCGRLVRAAQACLVRGFDCARAQAKAAL